MKTVIGIKRKDVAALVYEYGAVEFNTLIILNDLIREEAWKKIRKLLADVGVIVVYESNTMCSVIFKHLPSNYLSPMKKKPQYHSIW